MQIRTATSQDADVIRDLYRSAFPEGENEIVSNLAVDLLTEETSVPSHSKLAFQNQLYIDF